MDLFVVESPTQCLNAHEARHRFEGADGHLVILLTGLFGRDLYERTIDFASWRSVEFVDFQLWNVGHDFGQRPPQGLRERLLELSGVLDQALKRRRIEGLARRFQPVDRLFLGQYRTDARLCFRHLAGVCDHRELYLLDDGTDTVLINRQRRDEDRMAREAERRGSSASRWKRWLRRRFVDWNPRGVQTLTFFTSVQIAPNGRDRVIRNDYRSLRSRARAAASGDDRLFFLGQTLLDDGYLTRDGLRRALLRVIDHFENRPVVYVMHPRESDHHVLPLAEELGLQAVRFDVPVEAEVTIRGNRPAAVAGFFCSALENCATIFAGDLDVVAFRLPAEDLLKNHDMVAQIYEHLESDSPVRVVR